MNQEEDMAASTHIQTVINRMTERLVAEYTPLKIVLFGSYAYGRPSADSDIDLLIIKETQDDFIDRWGEAQRILTGTHRFIPVETLVMTPEEVEDRLAVGDHFIRDILKRGRVLYDK
jgi:predicted nucleotidyltransferase